MNTPPAAGIAGSDHGTVGDVLTFDASGSKPGGAPLAIYSFTFGDDTPPISQTSPVIAHAFQQPGAFMVRVTVVDASGRSDSASINTST